MTFSSDVEKWSDKAMKRYRSTARTAVQETVAEANMVRGRGGRMRVDTGFLRASGVAAIDRIPSGQSKNTDNAAFAYNPSDLSVTLLRWNPATETLFYGYVANYAVPREYKDGFLRGAVENWDQHVAKAAKEAERLIR